MGRLPLLFRKIKEYLEISDINATCRLHMNNAKFVQIITLIGGEGVNLPPRPLVTGHAFP
jgi:hypothetical protein